MKSYLNIKKEVAEALASGRAVVALESTILSHGMPYPVNIETALEVEKIIRQSGAVPATIALMDGKICVGLDEDNIQKLCDPKQKVLKASKRDVAYCLAAGKMGSTTVAATLMCASLAGIFVFVTGGIGGVHPDGESTLDISADLYALAQYPIAVIAAGAKSIIDIKRTLEVLETQGVPVIGYQADYFPEFYCRGATYPIDFRMDAVEEIAHLFKIQRLISTGGVLVCNPIPSQDELNPALVESALAQAFDAAKKQKIKGKNLTPFLLSALAAATDGISLHANLSLIKHNARLGAELANAL